MAAMKPPPLWLWALIAFTENTGDDDDDDEADNDDDYDHDDDNKFMIMRTKMTWPLIRKRKLDFRAKASPRLKFADRGTGASLQAFFHSGHLRGTIFLGLKRLPRVKLADSGITSYFILVIMKYGQ